MRSDVASKSGVSGVEFSYVPETGDVPLVADMSSNILTREIDVSKFGLIYAGAQKNIGCARTARTAHTNLLGWGGKGATPLPFPPPPLLLL